MKADYNRAYPVSKQRRRQLKRSQRRAVSARVSAQLKKDAEADDFPYYGVAFSIIGIVFVVVFICQHMGAILG